MMKRKLLALLLAIGLLAASLAGCNAAAPDLEVPGVTTAAPITDMPEPKPSDTAPTEQGSSVTEPFVNEYGLTVLTAPGIASPLLSPNGYWYDSINTYTGPITFSVSEKAHGFEDIHFEIVADGGRYYLIKSAYDVTEFEQKFTVDNDTQLRWEAAHDWETGYALLYATFKECYTRIVVYSGEHIVGYAVLRYERLLPEEVFLGYEVKQPELGEVVLYHRPVEDYSPVYRVVEVESVLFPKVDGQYQDVTREYVDQRLEDACIHWKALL